MHFGVFFTFWPYYTVNYLWKRLFFTNKCHLVIMFPWRIAVAFLSTIGKIWEKTLNMNWYLSTRTIGNIVKFDSYYKKLVKSDLKNLKPQEYNCSYNLAICHMVYYRDKRSFVDIWNFEYVLCLYSCYNWNQKGIICGRYYQLLIHFRRIWRRYLHPCIIAIKCIIWLRETLY